MSANDYSQLRGKAADHNITTDYAAKMRYAQDERNWFKRARGEWPVFTQVPVVDHHERMQEWPRFTHVSHGTIWVHWLSEHGSNWFNGGPV